MKPMIEVHNVTKRYHGRTVVDHLSFQVEEGEVFGLLGPNGAGKSTTIDCILGLCEPEEGTGRIFGLRAQTHRQEVFEQVGVQLQHESYQTNIRVDEVCEGRVEDIIAQSPYMTLEEAYLWYMKEDGDI